MYGGGVKWHTEAEQVIVEVIVLKFPTGKSTRDQTSGIVPSVQHQF